MLFRGQNILGYRPYADDVVEYFVQKSIANGIDIIRIFDCLNDLRNLQTAVKAANKERRTCTGRMSYTLVMLTPWITGQILQNESRIWVQIPSVSKIWLVCCPYKATELVKALKETVKIPIELHTHYTSGVASMTYLKGSRGGC